MRRLISLAACAALAACQQQPDQPTNATPAASPSATPSATATPVAALARYVGHYPTDAVAGGTSFLADPAVRAAVATAVPDAAVRARVLDTDVTATPIAEVDGRVLSYGCEPHNCGPHNWAIALTPDGASGAVCYYDEDRKVARWYPAGAGPNPAGGCPSGE
ncbi:hypothetical protein KZ813_16340 [Sphingomonas sp. RHCKR7]|uniref:hypothetical protein n=1 Tax=Sphingomonas folli TaxID=2862497 RepID=UPI001CA52509|nr:hypothetical protein [Sphingomonas folli]MBW6528413.1 hypothetical protein [Sphingomonas folli]